MFSLMATRPIAANLFESAPLRLIGGRHRDSGRLVFPLPPHPGSYDPVDLPTGGTLWSYTVQRFAPKSPPYRGAEPFAPYAIGYVELPGALIVESLLADADPEALRIGQPMELTTLTVRTDADGTEVQCYAFRPVTDRTR